METKKITLNRLPAITYRWLKMNEAVIDPIEITDSHAVRMEVPEGITAEEGKRFPEIETGAGPQADALFSQSGISCHGFTVGSGKKVEEPLRLSFSYEEKETGALNAVSLELEKDSEMTVIMDYTSAAKEGFAGVQTKIRAAENAVLHLVQIQRVGEEFTLINDIGSDLGDRARVEIIQLFLSGKQTYAGCRADLKGYRSALSVEIAYQVKGDGRLDMNYNAVSTGKKTSSEMNVSGVLRDRAFKIFRGTIDFKNGCAGSTGDELESVLLMDDGVVNQTIPLILCAEEDVVGNHGASIGRLDENLMFYLEARGMNKDEIYEMMAKAKIDAVIRKISDKRTKEMLLGDSEEDEEAV